MMTNRYIIGLLLGLTSAVVFVSAATGGLLFRYLFLVITALPIFLAGLGWGTAAGLTAAAAGSVALTALGWKAALLYAACQAGPAVVLAHLALLSRDRPLDDGSPTVREWYPTGRLVIWAAAMAGVPAALWLLIYGAELDSVKTTLSPMIGEIMKAQMPPENAPSEQDLRNITDVVVNLLPAASAVALMMALLVNLWLAGRIVTTAGNFERPWPDIATITFPAGTPLALALTTGASFVGGWVGMGASAFAATLLMAYVILGLAVIHFVSRGLGWRPFLLWALYATLFFANAPLALPLALIGLAEPVFHFRARAAARPPAPNP